MMLKKFLMAAGLAAAFSLSPQVAEAKVHIGVASLADTATIIMIPSAAVVMVIIPVRNILSPIRVMVIKTACPAMKLAGLEMAGSIPFGQSDAKM